MFYDFKCANCGKIEEYVKSDVKLNNISLFCSNCGSKMYRVYGNITYRTIKYSPELPGGNNKNLIDVPDELGNRYR